MTLLPKQEWTTFVFYVFKIESPYQRNPPSHFSQKAISVHIFISNIRFVIYSYWVHGFIRFLRKPLLHSCTLGIVYHIIIAEKNGRHFTCFNHHKPYPFLQNSTGSDFAHMIWLESLNGCSLLEENSMDKLKAATIFHSLCAKYSSPWKKW